MADIKEIAISYWRIEKWLKNTNVERKMAVTSSLRAIKKYLDGNNVEVIDLTGRKYDAGLAVEVIGRDYEGETPDESKLIISEMLKAVVMQDGAVMQFGQVTIGYKVKEVKPNNEIKPAEAEAPKAESETDSMKALAESIEQQIKKQRKTELLDTVLIGVLVCVGIVLMAVNLSTEKNAKTNTDCVGENTPGGETKETVETVQNSEKKDAVYFCKYTIQEGETLESIMKNNGIAYTQSNIQYIKGINGISDIDSIYAGSEILLPKEER